MADVNIEQAGLALHIVQCMYVLLSFLAMGVYIQCRDSGYMVLFVIINACAGASFYLDSWVPVVAGGMLITLIIFIGSGGLSMRE